MLEKAAACASRAWLRFCSTEYSCMKPFTSCGLHEELRVRPACTCSGTLMQYAADMEQSCIGKCARR